jgi:transposase
MGFREVSMVQLKEILRLWLAGHGYRGIERLTTIHRKTAARYVHAAERAGLCRGGGQDQLTDELLAEVAEAVRPGRPQGVGRGDTWELCEANRAFIKKKLDAELTITKIARLLKRRTGRVIPYRTLHRFCAQELNFRSVQVTVPLDDGAPGSELQVDFGRMGIMFDPDTRRRRVLWALIFTAAYSRHTFVWLSFTQSFADVTAGFEAAWGFFGGVFKVVIPDNMRAIVDQADPTNPRINDAFYEYAQSRGFVIDPARAGHPQDKARVERTVSYARSSFFKGENFTDRDDAQRHAEMWCLTEAGMRVHGTTRKRPLEVFEAEELPHLLPAPERAYDVPAWSEPKVHKDFHIEVSGALYSVPHQLIGQRVKARADSALVKVFHQGEVIKIHPRKAAGTRSTDPADCPEDKRAYATRDLGHLLATARAHGDAIGTYAERLLAGEHPWMKMRQVYRLFSLVRRHGAELIEDACAKALHLDVIDVSLIARIAERGAPGALASGRRRSRDNVVELRFAREAGDFKAKGHGDE